MFTIAKPDGLQGNGQSDRFSCKRVGFDFRIVQEFFYSRVQAGRIDPGMNLHFREEKRTIIIPGC